MAEEKQSLLSVEEPKGNPPSYDDAAIQHGDLPVRPTHQRQPSSGRMAPRPPFPLDLPVLNQLKGKRIILASASPRRRQILSQIFPKMEIIPSLKPENLSKTGLGPFEYVLATATQKCLDIYETALKNSIASIPEPALVISADTVVVSPSGLILEKPKSQADHLSMLKILRNQKVHKVYTAVVALAPREDARFPGYNIETTVEETKVVFGDDVSDELIEAYVRTREGVDKAGGYGLQGLGSLLVERIEGQADNVIGLPLRATLACIEKAVLNQEDADDVDDSEVE